ncbi:MAG TPA: response regulator, partial [Chroococcales cyanobacterium]
VELRVDSSRPIILVAEDNPINQEVVRSQLARLGFTTRVVSNGQEALEAYRTGGYSAILMDLHMPVMGGTQASRQIRDCESEQPSGEAASAVERKRIPIIAMTADTLERDRERCEQAGMDDYLSKPVTLEQLKSTLARHIKIDDAAAQSLTTGARKQSKAQQVLTEKFFDASHLCDEYGDETAVRMLQLFLKRTPELLEVMEQEVQSADFDRLRASAHELKGSCLVVQIESMSSLSRALEEAAETKNGAATSDILVDLKRKFATVRGLLEQTLSALGQ